MAERLTGARLRAIRTLMGIEQADLARLAGVTERTVRRWESGEWTVPDDATDLMTSRWNGFLNRILDVRDEVEATGAVHGEPSRVDLTTFRTAESFTRAHPAGMTWAEHSSLVYAMMLALEIEGYTVQITHAPTDP